MNVKKENETFINWKNYGEKRSQNQVKGENSVSILKSLLPDEWVIREHYNDYGIDLDVELFEEIERGLFVTKGEHILIQVKATDKLNIGEYIVFDELKKERYKYQTCKYVLETKLLATIEKMGSAIPVLLCLIDNVKKEGYFVCLNDYIDKILIANNHEYLKQETVTIHIPIENTISNNQKIFEWYGKRAKLYSLFNLINCQKRDLLYRQDLDFDHTVTSFVRRIARLDVWIIPFLTLFKKELDYFLEHDTTEYGEKILQTYIDEGEDVEDPIYEATYCVGCVS